jgi:hypothetical protein
MSEASEPQEAAKSSRASKAPEARPPADWAAAKGAPAWAFAGAKQAMRDTWVIGRDVTEEQFDKAIADVRGLSFGSPNTLAKPRSKRGRR